MLRFFTLAVWALVSCNSLVVFAQSPEYTFKKIPPLWRYNVTQSSKDRLESASSALYKGVSMLDSAWYRFPGRDERDTIDFLAGLASFDSVTTQKTFESLIGRYSFTWGRGGMSNNWQLRDYLRDGYAAIRAYSTYGDKSALDVAQDRWSLAKQYTITEQNFESGSGSTKDFPVLRECNSQSMKGATFRDMDANSTNIGLFETGFYFLLSASLAEATQDSRYTTEATQSANFITSHLNIITRFGFNQVNTINLQEGHPNACIQRAESQAPQSSFNESSIGMLVEGLCRLSSVTQNTTLLEQTINSVFLLTLGPWPSTTGAIPNVPTNNGGEYGGGLYLVRGLAEAYRRSKAGTITLRSDLLDFLEVFLGVQYNAVRGQNNGDIYGGSWVGGPSSTFDPLGQAAAAQVLVEGIDTFAVESDPVDTTPTTPAPTPTPKPSKPIGAIVGAVIGGVLFLLLLGLAALFLIRRRNRHADKLRAQSDPNTLDLGPNYEVTPFIYDPSSKSASRPRALPLKQSSESSIIRSDDQDRPHFIHPPVMEEKEPDEANTSRPSQGPSSPQSSHPAQLETERHTVTLDGVPSNEVAEMVRVLYQRMWEPDRNERPPAYASQDDSPNRS